MRKASSENQKMSSAEAESLLLIPLGLYTQKFPKVASFSSSMHTIFVLGSSSGVSGGQDWSNIA